MPNIGQARLTRLQQLNQFGYYAGNQCQRLIESDSPMRLQLPGVKLRDGINMDLFCDD